MRRTCGIQKPLIWPAMAVLLLGASAARAEKGGKTNRAVYPLFGFTKTDGPFPTDFFTVADAAQNTCERVNLPKPADCVANASDCVEIDLLNQLDGFNVEPRLSIPFHGAIDPNSVDSSTVFLVNLGDALVGGAPSCAAPAFADDEEEGLPARAVFIAGIEQVIWDPPTSTLYVRADQALAQHTRYALFVTRGVRDAAGNPVDRSKEFRRAIGDEEDEDGAPADPAVRAYERWLRAAMRIAHRAGIRRHDIVGASVFTTASATTAMEKVRDQVNAGEPAAIDFGIGPAVSDPTTGKATFARAVFDLSSITRMVYNRHTGYNPQTHVDRFTALDLTIKEARDFSRLALIKTIYPGAIGRVAYGRYRSTNYLHPVCFTDYTDPSGKPTNHCDALMQPFATFSGAPVPQTAGDTTNCDPGSPPASCVFQYVNIFVPSGTRPPNGWPVVIFGHGSGDNINAAVFNVAATFAKWGLATIGFNEAGCGFGPKSNVTVTLSNQPAPTTFPVGGRAIDVNGDTTYGACEGGGVGTGPKRLLGGRDGYAQTIADLVQLVRAVKAGVHLDGDGTPDLDGSRIFYTGISAGATIGTILAAIEPRIRATAVASVGGRPSPALVPASRGLVGQFLQMRVPPLLNGPGVTMVPPKECDPSGSICILGIPVAAPFFNENLPFPGETRAPSSAPVINDVAGALPIQEILDRQDWLQTASCGGCAYASHVRLKPLAGVAARPFLVLMPRGDQTIVNPNTLGTIRNGQLADRVMLYRHDLFPGRAALKDPHTLLIRTDTAAMQDVSLKAQQGIAAFFASDGTAELSAIDPDGLCHPDDGTGCLFESPAASNLEGYGFVL
jgi:Bacterial virulence factor lipase N-terminal